MASNEDILMQFTAQDDVSPAVEAMESSVTSALDAISSAMDNLDIGFSNLAATAEAMASSFGEIEQAFDSAGSSADDFQTSIENISADNLSDITSDLEEVSDAFSDAESNADNLQISLDSIDGGNINDIVGDVEDLSSSLSEADDEAGSLASSIEAMDSLSVDINMNVEGGEGAEDWNADAELGGELTSQDTSALRTNMYEDMVGLSNTIKGVGDQAVESASAAEQGWLKFGNALDNTGGNWAAQEESIKSWIKTYSNNMGRGVADTRTAMTTFLNMGMSLDETQHTMDAVSNYAAQFGMSQSEASKNIQMAFMGAGRAVKKLGLDIKDFKDEAGNVDKEKLLQAIMEKTSGAAGKYADSYEARVQRMNNAINSLRTDFGKEIINTIEPLIPIVQQAFQAFSSLPQPVKSAVLGFAGLAGGAVMVAGPLIKMKAYMNMAGTSVGDLKKGLDTLQAGYKALSTGGIREAIKAMKEFAAAEKATEVAKDATGAGKAAKAGKGMSTVADEAEKTVGNAGKVGGLAGPANEAGGAMKGTSVGLKSIGQGAMSMLAPLLEIAIVVAVLIPVITALAAEALIFLKGIQLLLDALDFDSIDLSGTINAIKQIGQALLEMGIAMAAMTFSNIMTGLAVLTSGVTGIINPVQVAGTLLTQAANELAKFQSVNIDESIPAKLQSIGRALAAVSSAMGSLTNVVLSMAMGNLLTLGGLLGNVTQAIATARTEIVNAGNEIDKIKDVPDLDKGAIDKLKKISESLEAVATAMEGLRSIRDGNNFDISGFVGGLFGGQNIQEALSSVKQDIIDAGNALQSFTGIPDIPDGVGDKLKKIADSLKSIGDAMGVLKQLRDDSNWDGLMQGLFGGLDIIGALTQARGTLFQAANIVNSFTSMPDIQEGIATKVTRVADATKNVANAVAVMNNSPFPDIFGMFMIPIKISMARGILIQASNQLNSLAAVQPIQDGIYTKVMKVGTSTRTVASALTIMSTANFPDLGSMVMIPINIASAKMILEHAARELNGLSALPVLPDDLAMKVMKIGFASRSLASAAQAVGMVPFVGPEVALKVQSAINAVRNVAGQLNGLQGLNVDGGIAAALASVRNAIIQLRATIMSMSGGFQAAGFNIGNSLRAGVQAGLAGLPGTVVGAVASGVNAGVGPAQAGGANIGNSARSGFQSTFKIADVASAELNYAIQALQNGAGAFYSTVREIAQRAVQEAKDAAGQKSPGHIARMWGKEMDYSSMMLRTRSAGVIRSVRDVTQSIVSAGTPLSEAFGVPELDMARINTLRNMNSRSRMGQTIRPVSITIGEGAVQLDARNLTTTESRQIMLNAIEGLDVIEGINVRGV